MEHYKSRNNDFYHFTNPHDDRSEFDDDEDYDESQYYDVDDDRSCDFNFRTYCPLGINNSKTSGAMNRNDTRNTTVEEFGAFIFQLDKAMKNLSDKLGHKIEDIGTRISRMEDETCKLEKYVEDVKNSEERYHGTTNRKLRHMQTILQEVQDGVFFLRDRHEIAETQLQLAKLQVSKRDTKNAVQRNRPESSSHIPFTSLLNQLPSNRIAFSQDISYRQAPKIIAQQHVIPSNQQIPYQFKADPQFPHFTQIYQLNSFQETPNKPSYIYASSVQNLPSEPARYDSTQEHALIRSPINYKSEFHAKYMPEFGNFSNIDPHGKSLSLYENSNLKPVEFSLHPQEESRSNYTYIPVSETLPQALPTAIDLEDGTASQEIGTSIPVDDIVEKVTSMGFRRDLVKACVRKLAVNGSTVDLNAVLDSMMKNNMNCWNS